MRILIYSVLVIFVTWMLKYLGFEHPVFFTVYGYIACGAAIYLIEKEII